MSQHFPAGFHAQFEVLLLNIFLYFKYIRSRRMLGFEMIKTILFVTSFTCLVMPAVHSTEWNYFGDCYSDDVIMAQNGKYFISIPCRNCRSEWKYGGTYRELADGVIQVSWKNANGSIGSSTYTHRRLSSTKCSR